MRPLIAFSCALACAVPLLFATARPAAAQQAGVYDLAGTNPDGSTYGGQVQLTPMGVGTFRVVWNIDGSNVEGVGIQGQNTLAVSYLVDNRPAVTLFSVMPNGVMTGQWTTYGDGNIGTETLTPEQPAGNDAPALAPAPGGDAPAAAPK